MSRLIPVIIICFILIGIDTVCLRGLAHLDDYVGGYLRYGYIILYMIIFYAFLIGIVLLGSRFRSPRTKLFNSIGGACFALLISKFILFIGLVLLRLIEWLLLYFDGALGHGSWIAITTLSLVTLLLLLYGILFGKYRYKVERVSIKMKNLPRELSGLKIVQISDIHSGTWDSVDQVAKGCRLIQAQEGDLLLFTGDLVNTHKDEIDPFIHLFDGLSAPLGKYAVLGNHDYVGIPRDTEKRQVYWLDLLHKFDSMGFKLLLNENLSIDHAGSTFNLIGVENWGDGRFFPKRGDLDSALNGAPLDAFTILMSHDPSHWDKKVRHHTRHIDLTLSGHTHGMQFGFNFKWFKWSPVKYRYKYWMGLYGELGQYLYVNRGLGLLAFPGRIGMWPEITVITLYSEDHI